MKHNLFLGVSLALLSTVFYSGLNAMVKAFGPELHVPMLVFVQSIMALALFIPILFTKGKTSAKSIISTRKLPLHLLRTLLSLSVSYLLFSAVKFIPLVHAMLLTNTAPMLVPFVAYLFLSQKINHRMWLPIIVGFIGVVLVLRPDGRIFHPAALLAIAAAVTLAATVVAIRKLAATESSQTNNFYFFLFSSIISGLVALVFWAPITLGLWLTIGMGLMYFASQYLYTSALGYANAQVIGSLLYTNIINSVIITAIVWHTFPSTLTLIGLFLTIAGGMMCIRVEYQHRKREIAIANSVIAYRA